MWWAYHAALVPPSFDTRFQKLENIFAHACSRNTSQFSHSNHWKQNELLFKNILLQKNVLILPININFGITHWLSVFKNCFDFFRGVDIYCKKNTGEKKSAAKFIMGSVNLTTNKRWGLLIYGIFYCTDTASQANRYDRFNLCFFKPAYLLSATKNTSVGTVTPQPRKKLRHRQGRHNWLMPDFCCHDVCLSKYSYGFKHKSSRPTQRLPPRLQQQLCTWLGKVIFVSKFLRSSLCCLCRDIVMTGNFVRA